MDENIKSIQQNIENAPVDNQSVSNNTNTNNDQTEI